MSERSGPFWDVVERRASLPPAAATLGLEFIDADGDAGTVELAFEGTEDFTNPGERPRRVSSGDAVGDRRRGPVGDARTRPVPVDDPDDGQLHAARPSRADRRQGRVVHREGDLVFREASLIDADDQVIATATATARVIGLAQAHAAA
jgi:hypothetical protein